MTTLATRSAATAIRLIGNNGESATFTRETETAFDEATGKPTTTSSTITLTVAPQNYNAAQINNDSIRMSDVMLLATNEVVPMIGDKSSTYGTILNIKKIKVQGQVVAYELHCRSK